MAGIDLEEVLLVVIGERRSGGVHSDQTCQRAGRG